MQQNDIDKQDQEIRELLRDYPVPPASAGFYDQALLRATLDGKHRERNRWLMTGFGSAVAAGLAIWLIGGHFAGTPDLPTANPNVPAVTMTLEEPRTINLVFASTDTLSAATLTVMLPPGIEMQGFPGQREITWETSLDAGKNLLPLKLIATSPVGGDILATLEHNDRSRSFRLSVDVS